MTNKTIEDTLKNEDTEVIISMPNEVEISLVQANELRHYELFQWLVVLLLSVAVGFWTAYFTGEKTQELFWSALIFSATSLLFVVLAFVYRKKVFHGSIRKTAFLDSFKKSRSDRELIAQKGDKRSNN